MENEMINKYLWDSNNKLQNLYSLIYLNKRELGPYFKRINGLISSLGHTNYNLYLKTNDKINLPSEKYPANMARKEIYSYINKLDEVFFPITTDYALKSSCTHVKYNQKHLENIIHNVFELANRVNTTHMDVKFNLNDYELSISFTCNQSHDLLPEEADIIFIKNKCEHLDYHLSISKDGNDKKPRLRFELDIPFI